MDQFVFINVFLSYIPYARNRLLSFQKKQVKNRVYIFLVQKYLYNHSYPQVYTYQVMIIDYHTGGIVYLFRFVLA